MSQPPFLRGTRCLRRRGAAVECGAGSPRRFELAHVGRCPGNIIITKEKPPPREVPRRVACQCGPIRSRKHWIPSGYRSIRSRISWIPSSLVRELEQVYLLNRCRRYPRNPREFRTVSRRYPMFCRADWATLARHPILAQVKRAVAAKFVPMRHGVASSIRFVPIAIPKASAAAQGDIRRSAQRRAGPCVGEMDGAKAGHVART